MPRVRAGGLSTLIERVAARNWKWRLEIADWKFENLTDVNLMRQEAQNERQLRGALRLSSGRRSKKTPLAPPGCRGRTMRLTSCWKPCSSRSIRLFLIQNKANKLLKTLRRCPESDRTKPNPLIGKKGKRGRGETGKSPLRPLPLCPFAWFEWSFSS